MNQPAWIEIFRTGKHRDNKGKIKEWTEADLDRVVTTYDPAKHEAPVVIGHPELNAPAFAWVEKLKRVGQSLFYLEKGPQPEFNEMREKGLFKKRSMSLYSDGTLRHIGWLGAMPPAVKGLADVQFAAVDDSITIEFSDQTAWNIPAIGRLFSSIRDFMIEKFTLEEADKVLPAYMLDELKTPPQDGLQPPAFSQEIINSKEEEGNMSPEEIKALQDKINALQAQVDQLTSDIKTKDAELAQLKKQQAEAQAATDLAEHTAFCKGLIKEGKMTPAQSHVNILTMQALAGAGEQEFAEGDKKVKKTPLQAFRDQLSAMPVTVEFSETATRGKAGKGSAGTQDFAASGAVDPESLAIRNRAVAIAAEKSISFSEALPQARAEAGQK